MRLTDIFIKRPVIAIVLNLALLLIGLLAYNRLTLRQFPEISTTVITVSTNYPGASAEIMESFVSGPLESAIAGVNGIDYITSSNTPSRSVITVHFELGIDINVAASEVSDKVSAARWRLPKEVYDPVIEKQNPNASPTMYLSFTSNQMSDEAITDYLKRIVRPRLETLQGVGQAQILGARDYAMRIWLDPNLMATHNITPSDVVRALNMNHLQAPSGSLTSDYQRFSITTSTDLHSADQFNQLIIRNQKGQLTRIDNIGHAELGPADRDFSVVMNNKKGVVIAIINRSDANPLEVSTLVKQSLNKLKGQMPADLQSVVVWDSTKFISESISEVKKTIIEATTLVILVMFLFLGSFRLLTVPLVTIPLSLIGICSVMLWLGFSLNTLTFLAMVLAIGLVVDDAIVVAENIHRHVEMGQTPIQAALTGAREIQSAVITMTFTLAAVFVPIAFVSGLTGSLFKEFAFTLAGAVVVSGLIALTLSPMMCSRVVTTATLEGAFAKTINRIFSSLASGYKNLLTLIIKARFVFVILLGVIFLAALGLFNQFQWELAPKEDAGAIVTIVNGPASANLAYTEKYTQQLNKILNEVPEKEMVGIINGFNGINSAISFLTLKPWSERGPIEMIIGQLFPKLMGITGVMAFPVNPYALPGADSLMEIGFVIETTGSYEDLYAATNKLLQELRKNPRIVNLDSNLKIDKPDINININRNLAGNLNIPLQDIANTINFALNEGSVSQFSMNGQSYDVIPQLLPSTSKAPDIINQLYVRSLNNNLVPLANVIDLQQKTIPRSLDHFQQLRAATISGSLTPNYTLGEALDFITTTADKVLPPDMRYDFTGESRQFIQTSNTFLVTLSFAMIFIILMLAAQFESFIDPFTVMVGVPLSATGAFLLLLPFIKFGASINIYTQIGLVTLIGLISKHGILIVEFANQLHQKGYDIKDAVIEAASIRLRPILMTTAAIVLGAIPLVLASGAGARSRMQIGLVIIGGMLFGTIMSLIMVPVIYTYLASFRENIKAIFAKRHNREAELIKESE